MSYETAWLLFSFAIMVVAVLATLHEKIERLKERLDQLEGRDDPEDDGIFVAESGRARFAEPGGRRDRRSRGPSG